MWTRYWIYETSQNQQNMKRIAKLKTLKKATLKRWIYYHIDKATVIDGDTIELLIDMGNRTLWREHFRLYGIDTPEMKTRTIKSAIKAKERLEQLIQTGINRIETVKPDKYGRTLVEIYVYANGKNKEAINVSSQMITECLGKPYYGGKK